MPHVTQIGIWGGSISPSDLEKWFAGRGDFRCAWSTNVADLRDTLEAMIFSPVEVSVICPEIGASIIPVLRLMRRKRTLPPAVLIMDGTLPEPYMADLEKAGVRGFVRAPLTETDADFFATAIHAVRLRNIFYDPAFIAMPVRIQPARLTPGEMKIMTFLADGLTVKDIALRLGRSWKTVDVMKNNLMHKLDVHKREGLVHYSRILPNGHRGNT